MRRRHLSVCAAAALALAPPATAAERAWDAERSLFAVITHKAGFAAGLAHEHLVAAVRPEVALGFDPAAPLAARFELRAEAAELAFDLPALQQRHGARLVELGVVAEPFEEIGDKDRAKIRDSALGGKQLDAARHPELRARLVAVAAKPGRSGQQAMDYEATVALVVKDQSVEARCPARFDAAADGTFTLEVVCAFAFTQFGIKPYSAAMGAVKNQDAFHLYALVVAR